MGFGPIGSMGVPDGADAEHSAEARVEALTAEARAEIAKNLDYIVKNEKDQKRYDKKVEGLIKLAMAMREEFESANPESLSEDEARANNEVAQHLIRTKKVKPEDDTTEVFENKMATSANIISVLSELALIRMPKQEYASISELLDAVSSKMKVFYPQARCTLNSTVIERLWEIASAPDSEDAAKSELLFWLMNSTVSEEYRTAVLPTRQEDPELFQDLDQIIVSLSDDGERKVSAMASFNRLAMEVGDMKWRPIQASAENVESEMTESEATSAADLFAEIIASTSDTDLLEQRVGVDALRRFFIDSEIPEEDIKDLDLESLLSYVAVQAGKKVAEVDGDKFIVPNDEAQG